MRKQLLLDESPLLILPSLACLIGLNEAIVLQQVHYWLVITEKQKREDHFHDGRWWCYNSLPEWREQFPWWGERTIRGIIRTLEEKGLLESDTLAVDKWDRTKWYTINYEALESMRQSLPHASGNICHMDTAKSAASKRQGLPLLHDTETSSETTQRLSPESDYRDRAERLAKKKDGR